MCPLRLLAGVLVQNQHSIRERITPVCKHQPFAAYRPSGFSPQLRSAAPAALRSPESHITACITLLFPVMQLDSSHLQAPTAWKLFKGWHGAMSCISRQFEQQTSTFTAGRSWLMPHCSQSTLSARTGSLRDRLHPDPISMHTLFHHAVGHATTLQCSRVCQSFSQFGLHAALALPALPVSSAQPVQPMPSAAVSLECPHHQLALSWWLQWGCQADPLLPAESSFPHAPQRLLALMSSGQPADCPENPGSMHPCLGRLWSHACGWLVMGWHGGYLLLLLACPLMLTNAQRESCQAVMAWLTGCWAMLTYHCSVRFGTCSGTTFVRQRASLFEISMKSLTGILQSHVTNQMSLAALRLAHAQALQSALLMRAQVTAHSEKESRCATQWLSGLQVT